MGKSRRWVAVASLLVATVALAGCTNENAPGLETPDGPTLAERTSCGGTFPDGTAVHCEQGAEIIMAEQDVPLGWLPSSGPFGEHDTTFYRAIDPNDPPGTFRLAVSYSIERGGIGQHISLDPIHGMAWYAAWPSIVSWESNLEGFVEFPYPIEEGGGEMSFGLFHPHTVAEMSENFNVSIETPALHDKPLEPLWGLYGNDLRVVHKVHGDDGPYYFHSGQEQTGEMGYSISQTGADFSIISRLIQLQTISFGSPP